MVTNSDSSDSPHWYDFAAFRFVLAANSIVALYSLFEMAASVWEISRGDTLFPESLQVWFDFCHDQVFAYLLISVASAGTELARTLKGKETCTATNAFYNYSIIACNLGLGSRNPVAGFHEPRSWVPHGTPLLGSRRKKVGKEEGAEG
ncbi:hypothetical protein SLEP1_g16970 [Rubroshorea leprosula]|uniref:CASP-like protein n=1 Tax=Rubroshorea leprosula TaxID=152421 RepID=A0AAV5J341_9ROSI|nr:hypothetical protein SLEP1_g16970 [Rubroshorea leprosula]